MELLNYLELTKINWQQRIHQLEPERIVTFNRRDYTQLELVIHSLRHVQHHVGQLNLILRQRTDDAPRWVARASTGLDGSS